MDDVIVIVMCVCVQSYGGFVASHMLTTDSVHCAVAVTPIIDWRYLGYTVYTTSYYHIANVLYILCLKTRSVKRNITVLLLVFFLLFSYF